MKQILLFPSLLLAAALLLGSCVGKEPEGCEDVVTIHLKDLDKYVPYTGTETLRFLHNSTDTQTFIGQGMERFWVNWRKGAPQEGCPEEHESIRVRFKNTNSDDEIKFEYIYDRWLFWTSSVSDNPYTSYKFYYNNVFSGEYIDIPTRLEIELNGFKYKNIGIYSTEQDTHTYFLFKYPEGSLREGILKIKYPNDTLTLLR